ncbi:uncharacterized protein LOC111376865 [Olea europaea var. sylvestris]|uniref:uncharacterized protein LOC111376865 n=1 Tax=Olea europaea var. sylvestris TaxID=158386 RepID=UPI000C1D1D48|nr:uncharacterized protein LOC111376865 [Olea europaea var. sylvestris]
MEILEKLLKFKFHILSAISLCTSILFILYIAPRFLDVIKYFWPLLVSTALFLVAVLVFGRISPPPASTSDEKAGEGLLDYVAGQPDQLQAAVQELEEESFRSQ